MRVYLPATTTVLRTLVDEGRAARPAHGVRRHAALREFYALSDAEADIEELEYAALLAAARASLRLLDVDPIAARRRVVLAADVADDAVDARSTTRTSSGARCGSRGTSGAAGRGQRAHRRCRRRGRRPGRGRRGPGGRPRQRGRAVRRRPGRGPRAGLVRDAGDRPGARAALSPHRPAPATAGAGGRTWTRSTAAAGDQPAAPGPDGQRGPGQPDAQEVGVPGAGAEQQPGPAAAQGGDRALVVARRAARAARPPPTPARPGRRRPAARPSAGALAPGSRRRRRRRRRAGPPSSATQAARARLVGRRPAGRHPAASPPCGRPPGGSRGAARRPGRAAAGRTHPARSSGRCRVARRPAARRCAARSTTSGVAVVATRARPGAASAPPTGTSSGAARRGQHGVGGEVDDARTGGGNRASGRRRGAPAGRGSASWHSSASSPSRARPGGRWLGHGSGGDARHGVVGPVGQGQDEAMPGRGRPAGRPGTARSAVSTQVRPTAAPSRISRRSPSDPRPRIGLVQERAERPRPRRRAAGSAGPAGRRAAARRAVDLAGEAVDQPDGRGGRRRRRPWCRRAAAPRPSAPSAPPPASSTWTWSSPGPSRATASRQHGAQQRGAAAARAAHGQPAPPSARSRSSGSLGLPVGPVDQADREPGRGRPVAVAGRRATSPARPPGAGRAAAAATAGAAAARRVRRVRGHRAAQPGQVAARRAAAGRPECRRAVRPGPSGGPRARRRPRPAAGRRPARPAARGAPLPERRKARPGTVDGQVGRGGRARATSRESASSVVRRQMRRVQLARISGETTPPGRWVARTRCTPSDRPRWAIATRPGDERRAVPRRAWRTRRPR